jgi:hypothetical protein
VAFADPPNSTTHELRVEWAVGIVIDGRPENKVGAVVEQLLKVFYRMSKEGEAVTRVGVLPRELIGKSDIKFGCIDPSAFLEWMKGEGWIEPVCASPGSRPRADCAIRLTAKGAHKAEWLLVPPLRRHLTEFSGIGVENMTEVIARGALH